MQVTKAATATIDPVDSGHVKHNFVSRVGICPCVVVTTDSPINRVQWLCDCRRRCTMSDSEYSRKRELECLGLASDLTQLASNNVSPAL